MIRRRLRLLFGLCTAILSATAIGLADPASPITVTNIDSPDPVASGSQLTYTITIVNTGGSKLTNMVLSDQVNGIGGIGVPPQLQLTSTRGSCGQNGNLVTCNGGSIEGNGSWVVTIRGIVTASNGTTINNTASISGTRSAQNFTTTATTGTLVSNGGGSALPDLSISKAGPTSVNVSSPMTYTLNINNTGTANAMNVKVVDTVPAGLTDISASGTSLFTCGVAGQTVTCTGGAVNQGANATITINATSPAATGTITNTAAVDPDNTIEESNELNNTSALVDTSVVSGGGGGGQLTINKTDNPAEIPGAGPDPVTPGGTITYKILVTNASNQRADDVVIVDGTQGLQASSIIATQVVTNGTVGTFGGCVVTAPETRCNVRTLNPGGTILMTVTGQVIASAGSTIFNTATVTGNIKNQGTSATDTELTTVKPSIDLTITKSDSPDPVCASSWPGNVPPTPTVCRGGLTYTFVVGNSGVNPATGVVIRDPLPPGTKFDSFVAPAFSGGCSVDAQNVLTCTGGTVPPQSTVPVTIVLVAPPTTGVITNTVTVDPNNAIFEADETNNTATATTTVITGVDLTITKTDAAPGFDPIATSGTQTYTIKVDDIGTQDVSNIRVRDTLPANTIFRSATSDHGFTCSQAGGVVECVGGSLKGTLSEFYPPPGPGNDVATIIIKIFAQPIVGTMHNEVRVDPLNEIAEANEANNIAVEDTAVVNGGTGQGAFNQLTILKTQVSPANPVARNAKVTYNIHIGNDGTDPAVGVVVRDFLPAGAHYVQATGSNQFHCTESNNIVDCVGGQLPAGGVGANITVVMFAPDTPGSYTNQAIVDPDNAIPEGNETDNQSSVGTTVTNGGNGAFIDLTIHKDATPTVAPGEQIVYTLTVSNIGSDPALNVVVRDVLPAGSTFVSADDTTAAPGAFTCGLAAGVVNCVGATIDGGVLPDDPIVGVPTVRTIKIVVTAPNQIIENYLNKAEVDPDNTIPEGDETNNTSSDVTDIHSRINLSITKNGPTTSSQSQTTSYNIVIKNNAPGGVKADGLNAQGVKMHDPLPVGLIPLAIDTGSGNNWACQVLQDPINVVDCVGDLEAEQEITIKIDVFMTAEGSRALDNEACVDPDNVFPEFLPGGETDNCSTHTTETNPTKFPDLLISKNVDATVATPGAVLTYTVVVANVGTAPARGALLVTDKIPDHTTFVDAIGGNGWTCTFDSGTKVISCTNPASPNDGFAVGASAQMTIHVTIDNDATLPISNTAKSENPAPADQTAPECTTPNVCEDENNALNDQASVTTSLSGSSVGIDLVISSVTDNPDPATRARALTYTVIALNAGTEATDPSNKPHVRLDIPPNGITFLSAAGSNGFVCSGPDASHRVDCVGDLPGGGNTVITLSLIVLQGAPNTLNMTATIDPDHLINELQEGNNTQLEVTTVAPGGTCTLSPCIDLVAAQLFAVPDPASLGGSVSVNFVVVNVGDTPTALDPSTGGGEPLFAFGLFGAHTTSARVTSPGAPDIVCTDSTNNATARVSSCFGNLAPGQGVTFTMTFDGVTGTDLFAIGVADPQSKIVEFVESNNTASKTIVIQP